MSTPDFDAAVASREPITGPFGKLDTELKTHLDGHTVAVLEKKARSLGMNKSQLMRDAAYLIAHDVTFIEAVANLHRERMADQGLYQGLIRAVGK